MKKLKKDRQAIAKTNKQKYEKLLSQYLKEKKSKAAAARKEKEVKKDEKKTK